MLRDLLHELLCHEKYFLFFCITEKKHLIFECLLSIFRASKLEKYLYESKVFILFQHCFK